jgi:hypothetical protein
MRFIVEVTDNVAGSHPHVIDLPGEWAARSSAKDIARQLLSKGTFIVGPHFSSWRLVMFDDQGKKVIDMKLSEALH